MTERLQVSREFLQQIAFNFLQMLVGANPLQECKHILRWTDVVFHSGSCLPDAWKLSIYSYLSVSAGFVIAAFKVCDETETKAMTSTKKPEMKNTHALMSIL